MSRHTRALLFGMASLGFLVGNLIGLSADSIAKGFIPLLFALGGGSSIVVLKGLSADQRSRFGYGVGILSLFCLLGTYFGIFVSEHQLLTPTHARNLTSDAESGIDARKLLRSEMLDSVSSIDQRMRNRQLTCEEAFEQTKELIENEAR